MKTRKIFYAFVITTLILCGCSRQNTRVPDNSSASESTVPSATAETTHTAESTASSASAETTHAAESTVPSGSAETNNTTESAVPSDTAEANNSGAQSEPGTMLNHTGDADTISEDDAKQIALDRVPGAVDQDIREFKTDYDNGKLKYEGKIYFEKNEYEFEIDAYTGTILEWDVEPINNNTRP